VVRHHIVQRIVEAYAAHDAEQEAQQRAEHADRGDAPHGEG
jgi:phosphate starvation-inducible protein PhoH